MLLKTFSGLALLAALLASPALADDGHGHDAAPSSPAGPVFPRFATSSALFELVGVVDGKKLTVYLDHLADNSPVKGARIDLDIGGAKVALKESADGEFEGLLADALPSGVTPVAATVSADGETEMLAAELDVHDDDHAASVRAPATRTAVAWGAAALAALAVLAWLRRRTTFARRAGGAA